MSCMSSTADLPSCHPRLGYACSWVPFSSRPQGLAQMLSSAPWTSLPHVGAEFIPFPFYPQGLLSCAWPCFLPFFLKWTWGFSTLPQAFEIPRCFTHSPSGITWRAASLRTCPLTWFPSILRRAAAARSSFPPATPSCVAPGPREWLAGNRITGPL